MRTLALLLLLVGMTGPGTAQILLNRLANGVCECIGAAPEIVFPRIQARQCLEEVAKRHTIQIREVLQLSTSSAADRKQLAELLIDPLTEGCPLLQRLKPGVVEPKLHYSDFSLTEYQQQAPATKPAPPDPVTTTVGEVSRLQEASGTLKAAPERNVLHLIDAEGELLIFHFLGRQLRGLTLTAGQQLSITYRYDWQQDARAVQRWIVSLK